MTRRQLVVDKPDKPAPDSVLTDIGVIEQWIADGQRQCVKCGSPVLYPDWCRCKRFYGR